MSGQADKGRAMAIWYQKPAGSLDSNSHNILIDKLLKHGLDEQAVRSYKKKAERAGTVQKRRVRGILQMCINTERNGAKRTELRSFHWYPVTEPGAMGTL